MASLDSSNPSPHPVSAGTETTEPQIFYRRSISSKEPPSFSHLQYTPPRPTTPTHLHTASPFSPNRQTKSSETTTYRCLASVLKKDGQILSVAVSNGLVYTGSTTNFIRMWKVPQFTECGQLKCGAYMVVALQISHDRVYAAFGDGKVRIWRRTWECEGYRHVKLATIPRFGGYVRSYISRKDHTMKHMAPITSLAISFSEDILYSSSLDKTVKVWMLSDFKCIETIQAHSEPINAIAVTDDGILYTASDDATVRVWRRNFSSNNRLHSLTLTLPTKQSPVKTLALTPNDNLLYAGCSDGYVHYWIKGWFSGQLQYGGSLQGHTHAVMAIASVGNYVISGSADSTSRVWLREMEDQHTCLAILVGHRGPVRCVDAYIGKLGEEDGDQDGCTICTGSMDGVIKMWRLTRVNKDDGVCFSAKNGCDYLAVDY